MLVGHPRIDDDRSRSQSRQQRPYRHLLLPGPRGSHRTRRSCCRANRGVYRLATPQQTAPPRPSPSSDEQTAPSRRGRQR